MRYYTRSSDSDILILKEEKNVKKRNRSKSVNCNICFCNIVENSFKKKKSKNKNVAVKYKKKVFRKEELSGLQQIKPCSVFLEKLNVKKFKNNFQAPMLYPIVKYELNQTIKPCSIYIEKINFKQILKCTKVFKPCSVVLEQSDFKPNIKREKHSLETTHMKKEVLSSFTNSFSPQHGAQSAVAVKTESDLCSKQDEHKQFLRAYGTGENEQVNEYLCNHCNKLLPSKKALYYHVCNTKMRNGFLCEICFKNFDFYHLLIKHKPSHASSLSCSKSMRKRRKSSSPLIKLSTMEQSLRESSKLKSAIPDQSCKLKENNPPKTPRIRKIFLKNPACASTSTGQSSANLEFLPYVWDSDESSTDQ